MKQKTDASIEKPQTAVSKHRKYYAKEVTVLVGKHHSNGRYTHFGRSIESK